MGETCGMKLVMQMVPTDTKCRLCERIDTESRRRTAEVDRIGRWQRDGSKFRPSIDKAMEIIRALDTEMYELSCERQRRLAGIGVTNGPSSKDRMTAKEEHMTEAQTREPTEEVVPATFKLIDKVAGSCGLPITFETASGPATVMAIPDSGANLNIISQELAKYLGYSTPDASEREELKLLDGGSVVSEGVIQAVCRFSMTFTTEIETYHCVFRVLRNVISPLIMSSTFLQQTETFSKFRNRLVLLPPNPFPIPRIRTLGQTHSRIHCSINGRNVKALVDSGSDIDVVSLDYAVLHGWKLRDLNQEVILADGRKIPTFGMCKAQLAVGKDAKMVTVGSLPAGEVSHSRFQETDSQPTDTTPPPVRHVVRSTFYVLDGIAEDALIGAASIESLKVFEHHSDAMITEECDEEELRMLNRIGLAKKCKIRATKVANDSGGATITAGESAVNKAIR